MDKRNVQDSVNGFWCNSGSAQRSIEDVSYFAEDEGEGKYACTATYSPTAQQTHVPSPRYLSEAYEKYGTNVAIRGELPGVTFDPDTGIVVCEHTGLITNTRTGETRGLDGTPVQEAILHESSYIPSTAEEKREKRQMKKVLRDKNRSAISIGGEIYYVSSSSSSDEEEYNPLSHKFVRGRKIVDYGGGDTVAMNNPGVCAESLSAIRFPSTFAERHATKKAASKGGGRGNGSGGLTTLHNNHMSGEYGVGGGAAAVAVGGGGLYHDIGNDEEDLPTIESVYQAQASSFRNAFQEMLATSSSSNSDDDVDTRDKKRLQRFHNITKKHEKNCKDIMDQYNKRYEY